MKYLMIIKKYILYELIDDDAYLSESEIKQKYLKKYTENEIEELTKEIETINCF